MKPPLRTKSVGTKVSEAESAFAVAHSCFGRVLYISSSSLTDGEQDDDQYAGLDYDSESATQHAQFRQYSPTTGRWMRPTPTTAATT